MGLVLDSGVLIDAEREARPVSALLARLEREHGETQIVLSSITVIELEHGLHRARTAHQARKRREYQDTVFAAISGGGVHNGDGPGYPEPSTLSYASPIDGHRSLVLFTTLD